MLEVLVGGRGATIEQNQELPVQCRVHVAVRGAWGAGEAGSYGGGENVQEKRRGRQSGGMTLRLP